jgi:hypothetical protein
MPGSRLDRIFERSDRLGRRYARVGLAGTKTGRAFQRFGRDRPLLGSLCQSLFAAAVFLGFFTLGTRGRHEATIAAVSIGIGLLTFLWQFPYNTRHHAKDRDLKAPPSAYSNRLTGND